MDIKRFLGIRSGAEHSPYTLETLSAMKSSDKRRIKSMVIELARTAQNLTKKDIASWRQAWQMAINPENPQRRRLYEVYGDVEIDLHLTGCTGQRRSAVMQKAFRMVDKNMKENREITELLEAEWLKDFMRHVLDSRFWGHSLVQFGDIVSVDGKMRFERVELVPRMHVIPEFGVITREAGDDPKKGISYRDGKIALWCIEAGRPDDLGLYLRCAPAAISKKNMLAFWDSFGEIFGMPIRIAKTASRDEKELSRMEKMLTDMGAEFWGMFPIGTELEIKETSRSDAFNVYDKRVDKANYEMSKCILHQTMTIDNGGSYSQSEVHLEVFKKIVESDADFVKDIINSRLLPLMAVHGFPVAGYRFEWDDAVEYSPEQMTNIEQMLLNAGYEIDPQYFADKYNIPLSGKRETAQNFFE
jgi:phage gp29-like protein